MTLLEEEKGAQEKERLRWGDKEGNTPRKKQDSTTGKCQECTMQSLGNCPKIICLRLGVETGAFCY